jgi:hypothetical protein
MTYKASLDTLALVITIAVAVFFIVLIASVGKDILNHTESGLPIVAIIFSIILPVVIFSLCWFFAPSSYTLTDNDIVINRPTGKRAIKYAEIAEVRTIGKNDLGILIRTFGNGGLFGYYGKFHSSKLGSMTLYTTQRKNRLLITTTNGSKIMITPDDLSLVEALKKKI